MRLAINDFNQSNKDIKLAQPYILHRQIKETWHNQIWICHNFNHTLYNKFVGIKDQKIDLM